MSHLSIKPGSENYAATIVRIAATYPIKKLNNLVGANVLGSEVLVQKSTPLDELHILFVAGTKLSPEYLKANNLYRNQDLNSDKEQKGYFEDNGRVKAVKFQGVASTAAIMPLSSLSYLGNTPKLKTGDEFTNIDGVSICEKYALVKESKGSVNGGGNLPKQKLVDEKQFPEHIDTSHLDKNLHKIELGDRVAITIKTHGTSGRVSNQPIFKELNWKEKLAKRFGVQVDEKKFSYVVGSRRVLKTYDFETVNNKHHCYSTDLWSVVAKDFFGGKLLKYENVYFEIIGKTHDGVAIQKNYTYGYDKPHVQVYRISRVIDGVEIDYTHDQVKERCKQMGVDMVPEVWTGVVDEKFFTEVLPAINERIIDKPCYLDPKVPEEGYVVRVEKFGTPILLKKKAPSFLIYESKALDEGVKNLEDDGQTEE